MANQVTKETYEKLPVENKLDVLYDYITNVHSKAVVIEEKLDKRKGFDVTVSGFMGLVGGIVAVVGKSLYGLWNIGAGH